MDASQPSRSQTPAAEVTIVGGGIAGLVAAIACAEAGRPAHVLEARQELGGRARSSEGPYVAGFGPHALYKGRRNWRWLAERGLLPKMLRYPSRKVRFRHKGRVRRTAPPSLLRAGALIGREAPVDRSFRSWAARHCGEETAAMLSAWAVAFAFDPDPGRFSAAFVWERLRWLYAPPAVRFVKGGWGELLVGLEARARELGVSIETGSRVESLPAPPVIVATELAEARELLGDDEVRWNSATAVLVDIGLEARRGDPAAVVDLDRGALVERYTVCDRSLAPDGHELIQAHAGLAEGASPEEGVRLIEEILDRSFDGWSDRVSWRRRQMAHQRTGAIDLPGRTWRDRPAIDRGEGVFLAGDMVAAPGILSEVSFESGQTAAQLACEWGRR
jgi:hypothetical protein